MELSHLIIARNVIVVRLKESFQRARLTFLNLILHFTKAFTHCCAKKNSLIVSIFPFTIVRIWSSYAWNSCKFRNLAQLFTNFFGFSINKRINKLNLNIKITFAKSFLQTLCFSDTFALPIGVIYNHICKTRT